MGSMTAAERAAHHLWAAAEEMGNLMLEPDALPSRFDPLAVKLVADAVEASASYVGALAEEMADGS